MTYQFRAKRDTVNPCAICGWSAHMAIHQPVKGGPRDGQPHDHAYMPAAEAAESIKAERIAGQEKKETP